MAIEFKNEYGLISVSSKLIAEIAANVAESCYGVVGMASRRPTDGLVSLLKGDNKGRGIKVTSEDNKAVVELHIVVEFGININSICKSIANRVRYTLESVAGVPVKNVNIRVEGIRVSE
ncbi:MAG: Asp23/Gls24 family envelope stress response protein [Clostridia bacterium]|nr:Asp23/Gls24 family envelope stress response protein [Clostridia bacterium]